MENVFVNRTPVVEDNLELREPQREGYLEIANQVAAATIDREVGIILPVGCGKSGLITLTPFAYRSRRALVVAPNVKIYDQLAAEFDPANPTMFYRVRKALDSGPFPEPVPIREDRVTLSDLEVADVVIANIQQLQGDDNQWLEQFPEDFFDLILIDEGHHNVTDSFERLRRRFPDARLTNFSATPRRADGQLMAGTIIYSYSVRRAIEAGYVKRLSAIVLNPATLKYVRSEDGVEVEVPLQEVIRLGEEEASFRRSIVTSQETLNTIVDASIGALRRRRKETDDDRHKIIASALNYHHCIQIVEAYRARGLRADYIHSRESNQDKGKLDKLERHELDVIVQVRKLSEGFDHPYLSVAAVFSIFRSLSPFVQFVGRIMRTIVPNDADHSQNSGVVIFHAGANVARQWSDFRDFSHADQEYFDELLPLEGLEFKDASELEVTPGRRAADGTEIREQSDVDLEEIPLIEVSDRAKEALRVLEEEGLRPNRLERIHVTKFRQKQASLSMLDSRVKIEVGQIIGERSINPQGRELDKKHLGKTNFVVLKSAIDNQISTYLGRGAGQRKELSQEEYDRIDAVFAELVDAAVDGVFGEAS